MTKESQKMKVCIIGAAGGIGQPLALLMKQNPKVTELSLYDVVPVVTGVAVDLSHICTPAKVSSEFGTAPEKLRAALSGCDVVIIPAGVPRKEGMTRDDLFRINANIIKGIAEGVADVCPNAKVCVISNPVNSTVPVFVGTLVKNGVDPAIAAKHVFGVTTLDVVRANTFIAECCANCTVTSLNDVPVVGGHSGSTIVPLLSQITKKDGSKCPVDADKHTALIERIQEAGTEVVKAKAGAGSATLSMAMAGARFANAVIDGLTGVKDVTTYTYVKSSVMEGCDYFSAKVTLGMDGVEKIHPIGEVSEEEKKSFGDLRRCFKS